MVNLIFQIVRDRIRRGRFLDMTLQQELKALNCGCAILQKRTKTETFEDQPTSTREEMNDFLGENT